MDNMLLESNFMRGIVAKLLTSLLKKKLGCEVTFRFNEPIRLSINKGDAQLHIDADIFLRKEELERLLGGDA